jgi:uncharacterized membrane protein YqjE
MIGESSPSRNPAGRAGFLTNLLALANALAAFAESRLALFTRESKSALLQLLLLVACLVAAILLFAFGYVFLIATAIVGLARATQISWEWTALGAAGVHFVLAIVFLLVARTRMTKHPFPETSAELKKDREWLRHLDQTSRPRN